MTNENSPLGASADRARRSFPRPEGARRGRNGSQAHAAPTLRAYQTDTIERIDHEVAVGHRRVLVVAPTGSGKTVIFAELIRRAVDRGERVLVLAHRRELLTQTCAKLAAAGVMDHAILAATFPVRPEAPVQVASVQTLHARAIRSRSIELPRADLVIVDEAHHIRARTYAKIIAAYPNAVLVGLTATPCRGDGRGLGNAFDVIIEGVDTAGLTEAGFLVPAIVYAPAQPNLSGVRTARGDYVESELAARVDQPKLVGDIVEHWHRLAHGRPTVVFATGVQHSVHLRDEFRRSGVLAEHIDGSTPIADRDCILARLAAGEVEAVCNAMVLTEGWDQPCVSCCILARPTKSFGLFRQMIGRVLRPAPGKIDALILDHAGAVFCHGLPSDPVEWTLREDEKAESTLQAKRARGEAPHLTECPECKAVRLAGRPCVVCGWHPVAKPKPVVVADGELGRFDGSAGVQIEPSNPGQRRRFHAELAYIAQQRGYKSGWAAHKVREKFGRWPDDRFVDPVPPSPATTAWVRSRAIAWARTQRS
jgi:DNA repair protein RadD